MINHMRTVTLYVDNQQESKKFWIENFGFEVRVEADMGDGDVRMEVLPKGAQTGIGLYPKAKMKGWEKKAAGIIFKCNDITSLINDLKAKGIEITSAIKKEKWGTFAEFKDIDGNEIMLYQSED